MQTQPRYTGDRRSLRTSCAMVGTKPLDLIGDARLIYTPAGQGFTDLVVGSDSVGSPAALRERQCPVARNKESAREPIGLVF